MEHSIKYLLTSLSQLKRLDASTKSELVSIIEELSRGTVERLHTGTTLQDGVVTFSDLIGVVVDPKDESDFIQDRISRLNMDRSSLSLSYRSGYSEQLLIYLPDTSISNYRRGEIYLWSTYFGVNQIEGRKVLVYTTLIDRADEDFLYVQASIIRGAKRKLFNPVTAAKKLYAKRKARRLPSQGNK